MPGQTRLQPRITFIIQQFQDPLGEGGCFDENHRRKLRQWRRLGKRKSGRKKSCADAERDHVLHLRDDLKKVADARLGQVDDVLGDVT